MRMRLSLAVAAVLYGGLALAQGQNSGQKLDDGSLDSITAGTAGPDAMIASGGAVVGNNSEAQIKITGTLNLSGDAQSGASGLNVVNSSESTVANGVNVWDGQLKEATGSSAAKFDVNQSNVVDQEQRRVAFLPSYERSEANVSKTWDNASSFDGKSIETSLVKNLDVSQTSRSRELSSSGEVNTETAIAGQTIRGGRGIAGAGDLDINFDGGDIALTLEGDIADVLTGKITLEIGLPELDISFSGGGCAVQMGSCKGVGTLSESESTDTDRSTITDLAKSSDRHETTRSAGSEDVRSPLEVHGAQAEYIVVDDSKIQVDSNYGVTLAGATQKSLRALNAVNAAGSAVANAVNISRTPSFTAGQSLALNQQNLIRHSR